MGKLTVKKWIFLILPVLIFLLPQMVRAEEASLKSGDRVILAAKDMDFALSSEAETKGLKGKEFLPAEPETETVWTAQQQDDGSWTFEAEEGRLSMDPGMEVLTLNASADRWKVTDLGDGTVSLTNLQDDWVLTWYPAHEVFGLAGSESEFSQLRLYILPEEEPETTTETTTETTEADPQDPPGTPAGPDTGKWKLFFGQLHAHTSDSDGDGTVAEAYAYAANVAGLDFFAVTDHSDSFDHDLEGELTADGSLVSKVWAGGKTAAKAATTEDFVAIYGFEMSWNQGQGHMSTFFTPGFASRDQDAYQMYQDGMEHYFQALLSVPESVSQFNHPGTTYGDFKAFSSYSPKLDTVISLIEVGSGAGSEYKTYFDAYVQALDQGWHLAPTNNQNNHTGNFGNANTCRTVVLAEELTEQSLIAAMKARRVYATEDSDLEIYYTLDGAVMGNQLRLAQVGDRAELVVKLFDPTDTEWGTVEVIGPGGEVAATAAASATVSFSLPGDKAYYFIRVTQPDGETAVTAPVWIRQTDEVGISDFKTATDLTRAGEPQTLQLTLFNEEAEAMQITSVTVTDASGKELGTAGADVVPAYDTKTFSFDCTFAVDGVQSLTAVVQGDFAGTSKEFTKTIQIPVLPVILTSDVLVDCTHGQTQTFAELTAIAAAKNISLRIEKDEIQPEQLAACNLLVIPPPEDAFSPEFLNLIKDYVNNGGKLLLLGKAGGSESLNCLLEALGSELRLNPDTARDETSNGGTPEEIYTARINISDWTAGILEGQTFAHINGCTVSGGNWLAKSGSGAVLLAEKEGILVSGSDFLTDAFLKKPENPWALVYANRNIAENLLGITRTAPAIAPMEEVRKGELGRLYLVEGLVTAGTHNINTVFPDSIYLQDANGAIQAVGYSEHGLELGRRVRILGCLKEEGGRPILDILQITLLEKETPILPEEVGNTLDYREKGDQLLKIEGTVTEVEMEDGIISTFLLEDAEGRKARVWAEDYILSGSLGGSRGRSIGRQENYLSRIVTVGNKVSAVGFCHLAEGEAVLRLRDCDEVVLLWSPPEPTTAPTTEVPTETPATEAPTTKPAAPAYPDNPPTGDEMIPGRILLAMGFCCLLLGICVKKKDHP